MALQKTKLLPSLQWLLLLIYIVEANVELNLLNYLLKNNSASVRPIVNPKKAINVTFHMFLRQIQSMDERKQEVTIQTDYALSWNNEYLRWNPKEWDGIDTLYVNHRDVWSPDLTLLNNADKGAPVAHSGTDQVVMSYDGEHSWYPIITLSISFKVNIEHFPFDQQRCKFMFESWTLDTTKLNLMVRSDWSLISEYYVPSPEWTVASTEKKVHHKYYTGVPNAYGQVHFTFVLVRKSLYYVLTLIVPCIILMVVILFSHFLPPASGERMGVVITVLLAFAVFLEAVSSALPRNSESTSVLSVFYLVTMILCTLSFLTTCLFITMLDQKDNSPPSWMRRYILRDVPGKRVQDAEMGQIFVNSCDDNNEGIITVREGDPCRMNNSVKLRSTPAIVYHPELREIIKNLRGIIKKQDSHLQILKSQDMQYRQHMVTSEAQGAFEEDWRKLTIVLNKVCFWFFCVLYTLAVCGIILPAYHRHYH